MNDRRRSGSPRGQLLIIVAFGMVALMAIGAIVVDLGMSWMLRRQEQNAADPASIAAARYIEEGDTLATRDKMHTAACFYAKENGFFVADNATCAAARASGMLQVHWPPISGPMISNPGMVQVIISDTHPSFFGQVLGRPVATVTTGAVAARESVSANTNSLVALDPDSCAAGKTHGGGDILIEPAQNPDTGEPFSGGYVQVNSSCSPTGVYNGACSNGSGAFKQAGNAGASITAPHIYIHGTCEQAGGTVDSPVSEGAPRAPDPMASLIGPRQDPPMPVGHCPTEQSGMIVYVPSTPSSAGCTWSKKDTTVTLTPGVYYGGWSFSGNNVSVRLLPGIYVIAGGGISNSGADLDSMPEAVGGDPDPEATPARVLIFSTDNTMDPNCSDALARCVQGHIKFSGKSSLRMWGLDSGPWKGMLMWQDGRGSNPAAPIELVGQGAMDLAGTIYAPKANVKITGNGAAEATLAVQIISWTWDVGGNGDLYMPYDPTQLYHFTQQGLVH